MTTTHVSTEALCTIAHTHDAPIEFDNATNTAHVTVAGWHYSAFIPAAVTK